MSQSPLTPNKGNLSKRTRSPQSAARTDKTTLSNKSKLSSFNEPSPASTYGDTISSSMPATPLETDARDVTASITQSVRAAQLDPAIKSISGSPIAGHDDKYLPSTAHHAGHVTFSEVCPSPSRSGGTASTNHAPSTNSSPSSGRPQAIRSAPTWRGGHEHSFVQSAHGRSDDPFVSTEDRQQRQAPSPSASVTYHPNRAGVTPTNTTAQAIFSPQACVFVANLNQSETDDQLEFAVTEAFQRFGNVYVKIRRDSRQMPFAFAQYTESSLYLSKINGGLITEAETRDIMAKYGPIELLWFASQTEREMFGLPEGVFARFAFFDDCRDAQMSFRDSNTHRLEQVKGLEETRSFAGSRLQHSLTSPFRRESSGHMLTPPSTRRIADARSIFIGNVPPHISEDQLMAMFQMHGRIMHVEIVRKPSIANAFGINAFAFLEYESPQSASLAVQASPRVYQSLHLRVEHKEPSNTVTRTIHAFNGSPRRNGRVESQEVLAAFHRGMSMGMSQAAQAQMVPQPFYPHYPYFQSFDASLQQLGLSGSANSESTGSTPQVYGAGYLAPVTGQFSYNSTAAQVTQYQQNQQPYVVPNPLISQYQWPPTNAHGDNTLAHTSVQREDH